LPLLVLDLVRHYGLLANRQPQEKVQRCRQLLARPAEEPTPPAGVSGSAAREEAEKSAVGSCPACQQGRMVVVERLQADPRAGDRFCRILGCDTS
jgi:hypothetical protein